MITYDDALGKILERISPMPTTEVSLQQLLGRVTAEPVIAKIDSPPFDNSAVDGFGVRLADVAAASESSPVKLKLRGAIRAGETFSDALPSGSAIKILTGAYVPPAVEAVVMREVCTENHGSLLVKQSIAAGENIRRRGGEFLRGHRVINEGQLASPALVGLVANLGYRSFQVYRLPKVAVVTTGNELTKPGRDLLPGKIYDSNSYAMTAAVRALGVQDVLTLHAREDAKDTREVFKRALQFGDVVISTGGVSVGDYDFVKESLEALGVETNIWRIAIKPGKPVYFGVFADARTKRNKFVFGLPGNPVSALVTFQVLVVPALAKLFGIAETENRLSLKASLTKQLKKKGGRAEFVRGNVRTENGLVVVEPTVGQDSHMLSGLATANALIVFPLEAETLPAGSQVDIRLLNWHL
jgi:molybdopterin molybdotransferase